MERNELEGRLGLSFNDRSLLEEALTHPSYLNENPGFPLGSNERLEFLGDAVLALIIALELYRRCPQLPEGELTQRRSYLVKGESLARVARKLHLGQHLLMGRGEEATGGRARESNLAAVLEALVGALFLDQGYEVARAFVLGVLGDTLERVVSQGVPQDPKSLLQQVVQGMGLSPPRYQVVEVTGPHHARLFTVEVEVGEEVLGSGQGGRKLEAERSAALEALQRLEAAH